jgi:hypothetical protein
VDQQALFYEDIYEALRTDIMALGGSKKVAHMLWPEKTVDKAAELLSNCLNRDRAEKLSLEQALLIKRAAKEVGSYAAHYLECDDIGFTRGHPIEPEDEAAKLQREFIEAAKRMEQMTARIERLQPRLTQQKRK